MSKEICKNTEASNSLHFDEQIDKKFMIITIPCQQQIERNNSSADELIWLLNESIQNKINWEHQKLMFWNQQSKQICKWADYSGIQISPIKQSGNLQICVIEKQNKREYIKSQIQTPDVCAVQQASSPIKIILQFPQKNLKSNQKSRCNCKKSQCLKMYCECFRSGRQCQDCQCIGCKNNINQEQSRLKAIKLVQEKEPAAFLDCTQYKGCRCTKSKCLKGYCDCFLNGLICGKYCKCFDCQNCTPTQMQKARKNKYEKI